MLIFERMSGAVVMPATLQFFYDVASPYSHLAFSRIQDVCKRQEVSFEEHLSYLGVFFAPRQPELQIQHGRYLLRI